MTTLIAISVLISALSFVYYFAVFLPQKENQKLEHLKQQIELSKQQFEYQKERDEEEKTKQDKEETEQALKEIRLEGQRNWERARAECIEIANRNLKSFEEAINSCKTQLCIDNMLANKELQNFGEAFIEGCTENRL